MENLTSNQDFDFTTTKYKLNRSKNVHEERDAPNQVLIGAMDPLYYVLLGLAVFLEISIESERGQSTPYTFGFNDDIRISEGGKKAKDWVQHAG
jgi:hypothetical protein